MRGAGLPPWGGSGLKYVEQKMLDKIMIVSLLGEGVD